MTAQTPLEAKQAIAQRFSKAAKTYEAAAFVQAEIGERLLERCLWIKNTPHYILNIGSATGRFTRALQALYPKAHILGIDTALGMCEMARHQSSQKWFKKTPSFLCADMESLPFKAKSFDLIVSNCTLEWSRALPTVASELKRVLKDKGTVLFTTVGPDTLKELAEITHTIDGHYHVNAFLDMHHVGDLFLKSGLSDPVMDKEMLTISYPSLLGMLKDIQHSGSSYVFKRVTPPFQGRQWLEALTKAYHPYQSPEGYLATIEIIYGYASKQSDKSIPTNIVMT